MYREFKLIERIEALFSDADSLDPEAAGKHGVRVGIGDDCAVLEPGAFDLISTDTLVEGVHFRRDWSSAEDIGFKAIAVSLSDVAAMGGRAGAFLLNLSFPPDLEKPFIDGLLLGLKQACDLFRPEKFYINPIGGDVTSTSGPMMITTTALGSSTPGGALLRSQAQIGDRVFITGPTGLSHAGLDILLDGGEEVAYPALLRAHRRPYPRVLEGAVIGASGLAGAMVDTSDGLIQDLGHICSASNVGARIFLDRLPRHPELIAYCEQFSDEKKLFRYLLGGGEDFQLCFSVPERHIDELQRIMQHERSRDGADGGADCSPGTNWELFEIGEIIDPVEGVSVVDAQGEKFQLDSVGYEHFAP